MPYIDRLTQSLFVELAIAMRDKIYTGELLDGEGPFFACSRCF